VIPFTLGEDEDCTRYDPEDTHNKATDAYFFEFLFHGYLLRFFDRISPLGRISYRIDRIGYFPIAIGRRAMAGYIKLSRRPAMAYHLGESFIIPIIPKRNPKSIHKGPIKIMSITG